MDSLVVKTEHHIEVDVIIPCHNATTTIEAAVTSAMDQNIPQHLMNDFQQFTLTVTVCCYDDGKVSLCVCVCVFHHPIRKKIIY